MQIGVQQNSKFTYLSNRIKGVIQWKKFSRIQNLHISQTEMQSISIFIQFSRIQNLHISQTGWLMIQKQNRLVEFKIYISLKLSVYIIECPYVQQNSKFTYLSNTIPNQPHDNPFSRIQNLHISQTAVLIPTNAITFSRIQNLHISQTSK